VTDDPVEMLTRHLFWGSYFKTFLFSVKSLDLEHLGERIRAAVGNC